MQNAAKIGLIATAGKLGQRRFGDTAFKWLTLLMAPEFTLK